MICHHPPCFVRNAGCLRFASNTSYFLAQMRLWPAACRLSGLAASPLKHAHWTTNIRPGDLCCVLQVMDDHVGLLEAMDKVTTLEKEYAALRAKV